MEIYPNPSYLRCKKPQQDKEIEAERNTHHLKHSGYPMLLNGRLILHGHVDHRHYTPIEQGIRRIRARRGRDRRPLRLGLGRDEGFEL